jgi:isochorismate synthase/2-succinyl-5-enolpyruvyl-6-hydroxy-3-cyclohexene-1-carboxylate synthase/2-succinyl-6-hydroxy-2,4-cyclohexadiene-1-carboxylate synthase/O-succinylbenzoate synthase
MQPNTLHPSVRCGVEMAVLAALAESLSLSLSNLLMGRSLQKSKNKETTERAKGGVKICALIESDGTPEEVADIAAAYVKQGFCTLKLKVSVDHQAGSSYISQNQPPVISSCFLTACRMAALNIH